MHIDRVNTRVKEGGHFIEAEVILRRYDLPHANMKDALLIEDISIIMDNSDQEFEMLVEMEKGEVMHQTKFLPLWLKELNFRITNLPISKLEVFCARGSALF